MKMVSLTLFLTSLLHVFNMHAQDIPDDFNLKEVAIGSKFVFSHVHSPCTITDPYFFDLSDKSCFEGDIHLETIRTYNGYITSNRYIFELDQSKKDISWNVDGSDIQVSPSVCTVNKVYNGNELKIFGKAIVDGTNFYFQSDDKCPYRYFAIVAGVIRSYPKYPNLRDNFGITIYMP
jgi:hypothetical protein